MTRLPNACILKNEYGEYLSARGNLTKLRSNAAVFERSAVTQVLTAFLPDCSRRHISTLSIEELPKCERRGTFLTELEIAALIKTIKISELSTKAARLRSDAAYHTKTATDYEAQAARIDEAIHALIWQPRSEVKT